MGRKAPQQEAITPEETSKNLDHSLHKDTKTKTFQSGGKSWCLMKLEWSWLARMTSVTFGEKRGRHVDLKTPLQL